MQAQPSVKLTTFHNQRSMARAHSKLECCASSREIASAVARSRLPCERRLILRGRSWLVTPRSRAEGERPLTGAAFYDVKIFPQPARHGARAQQARVLRLLLRDSERSGALARATRKPAAQVEAARGTSQHGRTPKEICFSPMRWPFIALEQTTTSAAPPPQRQRAQRRAHTFHAKAD